MATRIVIFEANQSRKDNLSEPVALRDTWESHAKAVHTTTNE